MTRSSILAPTFASGPSTNCGPTRTCSLPSWTAASTCRSPGIASSRPASPSSRWKSSPSGRCPVLAANGRASALPDTRPRSRSRTAPGTTTASSRPIKKGGSTRWQFDWKRWERWLQGNGHNRWEFPEDEKFQEKRKIKTGLGSGWRYATFCKTQYASRRRVRRHPQLHPLPPVRHPPARPDRPVADDEGRDQRRREVRAVVLHGRPVGGRAGLHVARRQVRRESPGGGGGGVERDDRRHVRGDERRCSRRAGRNSPWNRRSRRSPTSSTWSSRGSRTTSTLPPSCKAMKQLADEQRAKGAVATAD